MIYTMKIVILQKQTTPLIRITLYYQKQKIREA